MIIFPFDDATSAVINQILYFCLLHAIKWKTAWFMSDGAERGLALLQRLRVGYRLSLGGYLRISWRPDGGGTGAQGEACDVVSLPQHHSQILSLLSVCVHFHFQPLKNNKYRIFKSRYDSIDSYLSTCGEKYNDIDLTIDEDIYAQLLDAGTDENTTCF